MIRCALFMIFLLPQVALGLCLNSSSIIDSSIHSQPNDTVDPITNVAISIDRMTLDVSVTVNGTIYPNCLIDDQDTLFCYSGDSHITAMIEKTLQTETHVLLSRIRQRKYIESYIGKVTGLCE